MKWVPPVNDKAEYHVDALEIRDIVYDICLKRIVHMVY
jgi:hypothetical protein